MARALLVSLTLALAALAGCQESPVASASPMERTHVVLDTSEGDITLELYPDRAPRTVANFLGYVEDGFYEGTLFHRVIAGFMIQSGGYGEDRQRKSPRASIRNEADNGLSNRRGTIAMARTSDPHSASSQFFINTEDNPNLDHTSKDVRGWGYTVFGKVVDGMDVVDRISRVETGRGTLDGHPVPDVPRTPVVIEGARVLDRP